MKKVKDLFDVAYGVNLEYNRMIPYHKGIPFVSRRSSNNGIEGYVTEIEGKKPNPPHTISVACSGSVMSSFLQEEAYYSGRDIYHLQPKCLMNKKELLFYCLVLRSNAYRYSYGRQANKTLKDLIVPDLSEIPAWVSETPMPSGLSKDQLNDQKVRRTDRHWQSFRLRDVFVIENASGGRIESMIKGDIPCVTCKATNNGIVGFMESEKQIKGNAITIATNGTPGTSYYQRDNFVSPQGDVIVLREKRGEIMNTYIGMFIATLINQEAYRFNYARKGTERMKNITIKLPVISKGKPDWQFMEDYINSLPYSKNL